MNAIPQSDADAFAQAILAERPVDRQLAEIACAMTAVAMNFAALVLQMQRRLDAIHTPKRLSASSIIANVCRDHGVAVPELKSSLRGKRIVEARRDACLKLRKACFTDGEIARLLDMDHTSIRYALKRASGLSPAQVRKLWTSKRRTDLWTPAEKALAAQFASGAITLDKALAALPNRTETALRSYFARNNIKPQRWAGTKP